MLLIETLQTLGLSLLVFRVLPRLTSAAHAAVLLMGAALIPACLNLFCPKTRERRTHLWTLLDVLAVAFQLSAVSVWPLMKALRDDVVWDVEEELVSGIKYIEIYLNVIDLFVNTIFIFATFMKSLHFRYLQYRCL